MKDLQALVTAGAPDYKQVFVELEYTKLVALSFMDSFTALHEAMLVSGDRSASRMVGIVNAFRGMINKLFTMQIEAESDDFEESDTGLHIGMTGNICIYQLCFKNSIISIVDMECVGVGCQGTNNNNNDDDNVIIKIKSRKTTQLGALSGIRIPEGATTEIRLSRRAGATAGEGDVRIIIPGLVSFLGNTYSTDIFVNKTSVTFRLANVTLTSSRYLFDVAASSPFNPATTWEGVEFRYRALSTSQSALEGDMADIADSIIGNVTARTKARKLKALNDLEQSIKDMARYEFELISLKADYDQKSYRFAKAESDFKRNKTNYDTIKTEYRGYFSLDFLNQVKSNLSNVCTIDDCPDTCHTMRLYDMCQDAKIIEAEEIKCFQEKVTDRTTVLEDVSNMCDLTKRDFKTIYTGTCQAGKQEKLQGSLVGIGTGVGSLFGPVGTAVGAFVGWALGQFSSCDTSYETIKLITNYQVQCTQKVSKTRVKVFFISDCLPYPVNLLSEYETPYRCMLTNTSCIYVSDGACMQRNIECRNLRDVTRRSIMANVAAYNETWAQLDWYQTKLDELWYTKEKAYKVMLDARKLYERKFSSANFEKKNIKRARRALDSIDQTLSLEKCLSDFYDYANRTAGESSFLSFTNVFFEASISSRENVLLQMTVNGDDRYGRQQTQFVLSTGDSDGTLLRSGVRQTVQYYLCQMNSKKRKRSITEDVAITPIGRHGDLRFTVDSQRNVTTVNVVQCLHATTVFNYLGSVIKGLEDEIKDQRTEKAELRQDVLRLETLLPKMKVLATKNEVLLDQARLVEESIALGKKSFQHLLSTDEMLKSWKRKMRVYTSSNNFTACLDFNDCLETALENVYDFQNTDDITRPAFHLTIDQLKNSLLGVEETHRNAGDLNQLMKLAQELLSQLKFIRSKTAVCERPPKPKLNSPIQIDAFRGEKVILRCSATAVSTTLKIFYAWKRNDRVLPFETEASIAVYVDETTAGHYRCVAWNSAGNSTSNATHIVMGQKPTIRQQPGNVNFLASDKTTKPSFLCNVTADPPAKISWYYQPFQQRASIKLSRGASKPVYIVSNPRPSSSGYFYCLAVNKFGSVHSRRARLDVLAPSISSQEISVTFDLAIGNVETVNKTGYKESMADATAGLHQKLEVDLEASSETKVKFEVKVTDDQDQDQSFSMDDSSSSDNPMDDLQMVKQVSNKRFHLSDGLGTIVTKLETTSKAKSDEIKNSMVLGFDGNQCGKGSQLHSNGFACGEFFLFVFYLFVWILFGVIS